MDRGAWQATVHGVAESQTQLIDLTQHFPQTTLQSLMVTVSVEAIYRRASDGSASPEASERVLSSLSPPALSSDRGVSAPLSPPEHWPASVLRSAPPMGNTRLCLPCRPPDPPAFGGLASSLACLQVWLYSLTYKQVTLPFFCSLKIKLAERGQ